MSDHIIRVNWLHDKSKWPRWGGHFDYSKYAEQVLAETWARKRQMIVESVIGHDDDAFDFIISGTKAEAKFQSTEKLVLEYRRLDGTPSGLSTTKSDRYIMVNQGWSNKVMDKVGKIRVFKTKQLQQLVWQNVEAGTNMVEYAAVNGPGSRCVVLDSRDVMHDWLGDIPMTWEDGGAAYNFGEIENFSNPYFNKLNVA